MLKYVDENIDSIEAVLKNGYESIMKVKIEEGDPINDFINWITYIFSIIKNDINYTGRMNLLRYAEGKYLEVLGEFVGVNRIQEKGAKAVIKYTFSKIFPYVITIPKGHKIASGNIYFELDEDIQLTIGEREVYGQVSCLNPGTIGNNIEIGEINTVVDDIPFLLSVKNTTISSGGIDAENDENLRKRIQLKPTAFSTAGPISAYKYYTLTSHQDIVDVYVYTPKEEPGVVKVIPLLKNGEIPNENIISLVKNTLEKEDVRPFTDKVDVLPPTRNYYDINFKWWANREDNVALITEKVNKAVEEYKSWQKEKLGRDINPNKLIQLLINQGVKRVEIIKPNFAQLDKTVVAQENPEITINYQGVEDE